MKVNPHHTSDIRSDAPFNDHLSLGSLQLTENPHVQATRSYPLSTFHSHWPGSLIKNICRRDRVEFHPETEVVRATWKQKMSIRFTLQLWALDIRAGNIQCWCYLHVHSSTSTAINGSVSIKHQNICSKITASTILNIAHLHICMLHCVCLLQTDLRFTTCFRISL